MNAPFAQSFAWLPAEIFVERIGWLLLHSIWQFAAVCLLTVIADRFLRRKAATLRYAMLLSALFVMVTLPVVTWLFLSVESKPVVKVATTAIAIENSSAPLPSVGSNSTANNSALGTGIGEVVERPATMAEDTPPLSVASVPPNVVARITAVFAPWLSPIVVGWCLGVLLFSVRPVWGWYVVRRLRTVGVTAATDTLQQAFDRMRRHLKVSRRVHVLQSSLVPAPVVVGCFRSVVLLPANFLTGLPVAQLESILAHELAHVRRYDYLVNLVQTLVETVFFYHPAVWWLSNRIRDEREHCCDDLVVSALGDRTTYGRALLAVEEYRSTAIPLALSANGGSLLVRIKRMMNDGGHDTPPAATGVWLAGVLLAIFAATTAWSFAAVEKDSVVAREPFRLADHWIVEDLRWVQNDKGLISVTLQGGVNVRLWDVSQRKLNRELKLQSDEHGRESRQGTFTLSRDGQRVVGVTDAYVGVWDTANGQLLQKLAIPGEKWKYDTVRTLDCSADGSIVVAGLETNYTTTALFYPTYGIAWDTKTGEVLCRFEQENGRELADISLMAEGQRFVTLSRGHRIGVWDTSTGELLADLTSAVHNWESPDRDLIKNLVVSGIDISADEKQLAIVSTFGIRFVDLQSNEVQSQIDAPYAIGSADVVYSPTSQTIARYGARREREGPESVLVWQVADGQLKTEVVGEAEHCRFTSDGEWLAAGESDFYEALSIWPIGPSEQIGPLPIQTYDRIDRVEENTHVVGDSARVFAERWQPVWGKDEAGLQYGIAFTTKARQFSTGSQISMAAFVRNVSDRRIQIDFRPDMFGNPVEIVGQNGTPVELSKVKLLDSVSHYREVLAPGDVFGPLYLKVGLGDNPTPSQQFWTPYWQTPAAGQYRAIHHAMIHVAGPDAKGSAQDEPWRPVQLTTGSIGFTVAAQAGDRKPTGAESNEVDAGPEDLDADATSQTPRTSQESKSLPDSLNVMSVGFDRQGILWSVSTRRQLFVRSWDVEESRKLSEVSLVSDKHANTFLNGELQFTANYARVAAIHAGKIGIWDVQTGALLSQLSTPDQRSAHRGLSCAANSSRIACGLSSFGGLSEDAEVAIWDNASGELLRVVTHVGAVQIQSTALSVDGHRLATGSQDAGLCVWDVDTGELKYQFANENRGRSHPDPEVSLESASQVLALQFSPDSHRLAWADMLGIKVLDLRTGVIHEDFAHPFRMGRAGIVYSPDGALLALVGTDQTIPVWDTQAGRLITQLHSESHGGGFSGDAKWFAAGRTNDTSGIQLWALEPLRQP